MPTIALEGTGATISFGTSSYPHDVISITSPSRSREALETTHLGSVAKTYKPGKLQTVGVYEVEYDHNPAMSDLLNAVTEQITIAYPLEVGQTTPEQRIFQGFVTAIGEPEFKVDALMRTKISIQVTGLITRVPAT
jgi:hypothetical protein